METMTVMTKLILVCMFFSVPDRSGNSGYNLQLRCGMGVQTLHEYNKEEKISHRLNSMSL